MRRVHFLCEEAQNSALTQEKNRRASREKNQVQQIALSSPPPLRVSIIISSFSAPVLNDPEDRELSLSNAA